MADEFNEESLEPTYPPRAAARITGLSPELLRAWQKRHRAVEPLRTPGGTRRYRAADIERLRLIKTAVDAGHRIGELARLERPALERLAAGSDTPAAIPLAGALRALEALDAAELQRLAALQLAALGPAHFARVFAAPLLREVGARWQRGRLGIASEHLVAGVLRSMLGSALQPSAASVRGQAVLFATPSGERHELGLLMAALTAMAAGAHAIYLGAEVPADELCAAAERVGAAAVALGLVGLPGDRAERAVLALRAALTDAAALWLGGPGAGGLRLPPGVERLESLDELGSRVALLAASLPREARPGA